MSKLFFKVFFYTSLVVAVVVITALICSSIFGQFIDMPAAVVHPSEEWISTVVIAFFPIATTVLCGLLALVVAAPAYAMRKKPIAAPPKNTRFFLYYFIALMVVSLLVLLSCLLIFAVSERYIELREVFVFAILYGACIAEALVVAALLVSFFTLWKTNKPIACIIGVVILLIIPATCISGCAVHAVSYHPIKILDNYYNYSYNYSPGSVVEDDSEEDTSEDYAEEDPKEYADSDYLSFLWNENDNVSNTFAYLFQKCLDYWADDYPNLFLYNIRYKIEDFGHGIDEDGWGVYNEEQDWAYPEESTLRKVYYYLKENPSEILRTFYSYQNMIYQYMPIEKFYGTGAEGLLKQVIIAHDDLYSDDDLGRLQKIYELMTNDAQLYYTDECYDNIKLHIDDSSLSYFYNKDGELYKGGVIWAYSFWARRNADGTDDIAYTILNVLQDYYSEAEYYKDYSDEEYLEEE